MISIFNTLSTEIIMEFLFYSDLHLEFKRYTIPNHRGWLPRNLGEKDVGVVLAGDIHVKTNAVDFLVEVASRFKFVIYVFGNHEHYGESVLRTKVKLLDKLNLVGINNVFVLENESVVIDDVTFIGATLWTDVNNGNPLDMMAIRDKDYGMTDYKVIKHGLPGGRYRKLTPTDTIQLHIKSKQYIFEQLQQVDREKTVVITHHAPSYLSVDDQHKEDQFNCAYCSELGNSIAEVGPKFWIHGHLHHSNDYMIGNTRIMSNPRGYWPKEINPEFQDSWLVSI